MREFPIQRGFSGASSFFFFFPGATLESHLSSCPAEQCSQQPAEQTVQYNYAQPLQATAVQYSTLQTGNSVECTAQNNQPCLPSRCRDLISCRPTSSSVWLRTSFCQHGLSSCFSQGDLHHYILELRLLPSKGYEHKCTRVVTCLIDLIDAVVAIHSIPEGSGCGIMIPL